MTDTPINRRDYFAAHAPEGYQGWFEPVMPPKPETQAKPVGYAPFSTENGAALMHRAGQTVEEVVQNVNMAAWREGFRGTAEERLAKLQWEIRPLYAAPVQPQQQMDADAWAELHRLRAEAEAPDGFSSWKAAAIAERNARVQGHSLEVSASLVEAVTKAILFADCGNSDQWEDNTGLGEAAIRALRAAEGSAQPQPNPWREAVINELITAHIYQQAHDDDPRKAVQDAITWHTQVALDPAVSSDAQALIEQGKAQTPKHEPDADLALDLLAELFAAYENGVQCYEDPDEQSGYLGHAFRLDERTFKACAGLLNKHRPVENGITQQGGDDHE